MTGETIITWTTRERGQGRIPRLPLEGQIDLTYRCNNACRHCWLWLPAGAAEQKGELSFEEIRHIVAEARALGCREWTISGGEPMLRPDFPEIFDLITAKAIVYSLNTNGTLITPDIARLMKRRGNKMVALYGADAALHDHVTRVPGSFEAAMRGFALLREAGARFTVQLIPMRDNFHQFDEMVKLARSLSPRYRVGAPWLWLSAEGSARRNAEIARQRLDPKTVIALDPPVFDDEDRTGRPDEPACPSGRPAEGLFAACIARRRNFHLDPYGGLSFCAFIKDPALRYDLRKGSFAEGWEVFIPSLAEKVQAGPGYAEKCGKCRLRGDCRWCPVYGYLEHRDYSAPVEYLCEIAEEAREYRENRAAFHRRHYRIAGITVAVDSDLPIDDRTFDPKFEAFRTPIPGDDVVRLHHHVGLPRLTEEGLGKEVYRKPPWVIYRRDRGWIYQIISPDTLQDNGTLAAVFNDDHSTGDIYYPDAAPFRSGNLGSLSSMITDQIFLAPVLAERDACILHSAAAILNGGGLLFVGHSEAGKSTTVKMLQDRAEILCDDRNIVRRWPDGFRLHGTWSHGEVPLVSAAEAPLRAILFLKKAKENRLIPVLDRKLVFGRLWACLIRSFASKDWREKTASLIEKIAFEVPCYDMAFDTSGRVAGLLDDLTR